MKCISRNFKKRILVDLEFSKNNEHFKKKILNEWEIKKKTRRLIDNEYNFSCGTDQTSNNE